MIPSISLGKNENGEEIFVSDEMVANLLAPEHFGKAQKEAEIKQKQLSKEEWHRLRVRCKRDLFFFCYGILGNTRLSVNLHGDLCSHIHRTEQTHRFRGFLLPRGNFKSTIVTIGHSLQICLPYTEEDRQYDDTGYDLPWPMSLGTDSRVLIAHETHESAARFLYAITNHVTNNAKLMALFPEMVPSPRRHRVNKWELELPRSITGNPEPTIDTLGVGGKSQGRHYNYIKLDDIYGDKARDSEAEAETTKQWFDNIQAFFSLFSKDRLDLIGTRYSFDDIYAHAMERYGKQMVWFTRKLVETNAEGGKYITFPEEFTFESIEILQKNKKVFQAQYQNDPEEGARGFDSSWKRYFYWLSPITLAVFSGDGRERTLVNVRDLDVSILIDPGLGKSGGFCVTGMDYLRRVFVLVALSLEDFQPQQLVDLIFQSVSRWQPRTVAFEADLFASVYESYLTAEMRLRNKFFHVTPTKTAKRLKDERISGLIPYFANNQMFMNENQPELIEEFRRWGKSKNIHILDALAYGPEVWRPGWVPGTRAEVTSVEASGPDGDRDVQTGYSAIN